MRPHAGENLEKQRPAQSLAHFQATNFISDPFFLFPSFYVMKEAEEFLGLAAVRVCQLGFRNIRTMSTWGSKWLFRWQVWIFFVL